MTKIIKFPVEKTAHIGHTKLMALPPEDTRHILEFIQEQLEGELRLGYGLLDDSSLPEDFDFHENFPLYAITDSVMQEVNAANKCWLCNPDVDINETPYVANETPLCLGCVIKLQRMQQASASLAKLKEMPIEHMGKS